MVRWLRTSKTAKQFCAKWGLAPPVCSLLFIRTATTAAATPENSKILLRTLVGGICPTAIWTLDQPTIFLLVEFSRTTGHCGCQESSSRDLSIPCPAPVHSLFTRCSSSVHPVSILCSSPVHPLSTHYPSSVFTGELPADPHIGYIGASAIPL